MVLVLKIAQISLDHATSRLFSLNLPENGYSNTSSLSAMYCTISAGRINRSASESGISKPTKEIRFTQKSHRTVQTATCLPSSAGEALTLQARVIASLTVRAIRLLRFYILGTFMVISGPVPTCDSVYSR